MRSRRIVFDGACDSFLYFSCPSFTTKGIRYDMTICKRTGEVRCGCMDASCRIKRGDFMEPENGKGCKHVQVLLRSTARIRQEQIQTALYA